jgi:L-threonylcarbamoyladenylate synthase
MACLVGGVDEASRWAERWGEPVDRVVRRHWPGALTVVVRTAGCPFPSAQRGVPKLGLRVPDRPSVLALLARLGEPLAATSANRSGEPELPDADAVMTHLGAGLDLVVDDRTPVTGTPSTVLEWDGSRWSVLRQGGVVLQESRVG